MKSEGELFNDSRMHRMVFLANHQLCTSPLLKGALTMGLVKFRKVLYFIEVNLCSFMAQLGLLVKSDYSDKNFHKQAYSRLQSHALKNVLRDWRFCAVSKNDIVVRGTLVFLAKK